MAKNKVQRDRSSYNAFINPDGFPPYYNRWSYDKNYLNVLFNKRVALQNSELNEMSSIIQSQLGNITSHFVKNGSRIYKAQIAYNTDENYFVANISDVTLFDSLIGQNVTGSNSGAVINILNYEKISSVQAYVYYNYLSIDFTDGETFTTDGEEPISFQHVAGSTDKCLTAINEEGQIYINGYFINIPSTTLKLKAIDWKNKTVSICYFITQEIITPDIDSSLLEPNVQTENFNAPGANRFVIRGELFSYDVNDDTIPDTTKNACFGGIVVQNGVMIIDDENDFSKERSAFIDVLAKRTYNESGNYSVHSWPVYKKEDENDESNYIIEIQPGDGYIKGYYVKSIVSQLLTVPKPRDTIVKSPEDIQASAGNTFVYGAYNPATLKLDATALPDFSTYPEVQCMSKTNGTGTVLGNCRIVGYNKTPKEFFIFLSEIDGISTLITSVKSLKNSAGYINLRQNVETGLTEYGGKPSPQIIPLKYDMIKNLTNIIYTKQTIVTASSTSNVFTFDSSIVGIVDVQASDGTHLDLQNVTQSGNSWTVPGSGSASYTVIVNQQYTSSTGRKKTIATGSDTITAPNGIDSVMLSREDIFSITSITQTSNLKTGANPNVLSLLKFDSGQRDFFYDKGSVYGLTSSAVRALKANPILDTNYSITYSYYVHESGSSAPFTATSYPDYNNIPTFFSKMTGIRYDLRSCIDFRIKKSEIGSNKFLFPNPNTKITYTPEIYLPRKDLVFVDSIGRFLIAQGIPSLNPEWPELPGNAMGIASIDSRGYVSSLSDVNLRMLKTQRYTMTDIGRIDDNVNNLIYAVSMQQLHNSTEKMKVVDTQNRDCYKTGIFTDSFIDYSNSDWKNPDWYACIDAIEQSIITPYNVEHRNFVYNKSESVNIQDYKYVATIKPIDRRVCISNEAVSEYINVVRQLFIPWIGVVELTPSIDTWVDDLGNTIHETYTETSQPPTQNRSWTNTSTQTSTSRMGGGAGFSVGFVMLGGGGGSITTTTTTTTTTNTETTTFEDAGFVQESSVTSAFTRKSEFMRTREVKYRVIGLRPGIEIQNVTFNSIDISKIVSNLKIDNEGILEGSFTIPANQPCGRASLFFGDTAETTWANGIYQATGSQVWSETTNAYIRTWEPVVTTSSTTSSTSTSTTINIPGQTQQRAPSAEGAGADDPTAQTFLVGDLPVMLESIDLYFYTKAKTTPIQVYIVETDNGYPTNKMIPGASCILQPSKVNVGIDKPTNFKFDNPVYLNANTEYAFIVFTTSYDYNIYISRIGRTDLLTGIGISEQPYTGSFFNSQNRRTWTADQSADVTFKMYQYIYPTDQRSFITFDVEQNTSSFEAVAATLTANVYSTDLTSVKYEYKWSDDGEWKDYTNRITTNFSTLKNINMTDVNADKPLQLRLTFNTISEFISPQIDLEQVYGIFTNNAVKPNNDPNFPYYAGTYISTSNKTKYAGQDLKIYLDAILPNRSKVDVSIKMDEFSPSYVTQSNLGVFGTDTAFDHNILKNTQCQVYYYNNDTDQLEPKTKLIFTGYDYTTRKIYLRSVGNIDDFKNIVVETATESLYEDLFNNYIAIAILPILSDVNIPLTAYDEMSGVYAIGDYVYFNNYIWKKIKSVQGIPNDFNDVWEKITVIKVNSSVRQDPNTEWRKMEMVVSPKNTPDISSENWIEYVYLPQIAIEKDFTDYTIRFDMYSRDKVNIPRVKNLRGISMRETNSPYKPWEGNTV